MAKAKRQPQRQHQSGNPARRAAAPAAGRQGAATRAAAAPPSALRASLNRISAPALLWMHRLPRWAVPVAMGLLLTAGLFLGGSLTWLGALLLLIVALFVAWLLALSWPVLSGGGRFARGMVAVALFGLTALKAAGRL